MRTKIIKNPTRKLWEWNRPVTTTAIPMQQHHPRNTPPFRSPMLMSNLSSTNRMGKIEYTRWIEEKKKLFKVGDLVTMSVCNPQPNICPWTCRVTYIEEDHNHVIWDNAAFEPAAISVITDTGVTNHKAPSTLRLLTEEEKQLANLKNRQPLGTA